MKVDFSINCTAFMRSEHSNFIECVIKSGKASKCKNYSPLEHLYNQTSYKLHLAGDKQCHPCEVEL